MIKIGVFDDIQEHIEYTVKHITDELRQRNIQYILHTYTNIQYFKEKINNSSFDYDVLFLDIRTEDGTSIEMANEISKRYKDVQIIYTTNYDIYAKDVFDSNVLYFLDKKDIPEKMGIVIEKILDYFQNHKLTIKNKNTLHVINLKDIIYIERKLRQTYIITSQDKVFECYEKLSDIQEKLNCYFVRTHNSFIVNISFVQSITPAHVILTSEKIIPISRQYKNIVKTKILNQRI